MAQELHSRWGKIPETRNYFMKTVRLIKFQDIAERPIKAESRVVKPASQDAVRNWLSEYQQQKQANPREQFAQLFKIAA